MKLLPWLIYDSPVYLPKHIWCILLQQWGWNIVGIVVTFSVYSQIVLILYRSLQGHQHHGVSCHQEWECLSSRFFCLPKADVKFLTTGLYSNLPWRRMSHEDPTIYFNYYKWCRRVSFSNEHKHEILSDVRFFSSDIWHIFEVRILSIFGKCYSWSSIYINDNRIKIFIVWDSF